MKKKKDKKKKKRQPVLTLENAGEIAERVAKKLRQAGAVSEEDLRRRMTI